MWQLGVLTNQEIGVKFGLTYSAVSKRAGKFKNKLSKDEALQQKFSSIKAQTDLGVKS